MNTISSAKMNRLGRVEFKTPDGRVLFTVTPTDDLTGLNIRVVDPQLAGSRIKVIPEASNSITVYPAD